MLDDPNFKFILRRLIRTRLAAELQDREGKSAAICRAIVRHPSYVAARTVAIFDAMPSEPDLAPLWQLAPRRFLYPRVDGENLLLLEHADPSTLAPSSAGHHYREPAHDPTRIVSPSEVELILVPGLAFTRDGHRLGRGRGFYDRLLATLPAGTAKLGVCFELQIVPDIPLDPHDVSLDAVITEISAG